MLTPPSWNLPKAWQRRGWPKQMRLAEWGPIQGMSRTPVQVQSGRPLERSSFGCGPCFQEWKTRAHRLSNTCKCWQYRWWERPYKEKKRKEDYYHFQTFQVSFKDKCSHYKLKAVWIKGHYTSMTTQLVVVTRAYGWEHTIVHQQTGLLWYCNLCTINGYSK